MAIDDRQLKLTIPDTAPSNDHVTLTALTQDDAAEFASICDLEGLKLVDTTFEYGVPGVEPCRLLQLWAAFRAAQWTVGFELPTGFVQACFAVRKRVDLSRLAGMVGFNSPYGWLNRVNVYYWTAPWARRRGVAAHAVKAGVPWALKTFGVTEAFINATSDASDGVALKAGFKPLVGGVRSWWIYPS